MFFLVITPQRNFKSCGLPACIQCQTRTHKRKRKHVYIVTPVWIYPHLSRARSITIKLVAFQINLEMSSGLDLSGRCLRLSFVLPASSPLFPREQNRFKSGLIYLPCHSTEKYQPGPDFSFTRFESQVISITSHLSDAASSDRRVRVKSRCKLSKSRPSQLASCHFLPPCRIYLLLLGEISSEINHSSFARLAWSGPAKRPRNGVWCMFYPHAYGC